MRTIELSIDVFQFAELDEDGKESAREWWRNLESSYGFYDLWYEAIESRKAFLAYFDAELHTGHYQSERVQAGGLGSYMLEIGELHGPRLWKYIVNNYTVDLSGNCPFTGVCWDEVLLDGIRKFLKSPDNTELNELLYSCCETLRIAVESEIEYRLSDEAVEESIECNEYEFRADGSIYF